MKIEVVDAIVFDDLNFYDVAKIKVFDNGNVIFTRKDGKRHKLLPRDYIELTITEE